MRTSLAALLCVFALAPAVEGRHVTMIVVSESGPAAGLLPAGPQTLVAIDGGYIEGGRSVAGEKPPSADLVRQGMLTALTGAGFIPTTLERAPTLIVTYHWGLLQPDPNQRGRASRMPANQRARVALIVPSPVMWRVENSSQGSRLATVDPEIRDAFELSEQPRYFVIVSAYLAAQSGDEKPQFIWRTRLSTENNAGAMYEAIPAILAAASPHLGRAVDEARHVELTVARLPRPPRKAPTSAGPAAPAVFEPTVRFERALFAGEVDPYEIR